MWSRNRFSFLPLCALLLAPLGCGEGDDDEPEQTTDAAHDHDAGDHDDHHHPAGDHDEFEEVPCTETHPDLEPGLSWPVGDLTVRILSSDPANRARQKVRNDWNIEVVDADGAPVTDVEILAASTFMEVHGHPGLPNPMYEKLAGPGQFKLDNLMFSMRGPWEVLVTLQRGSEREQNAKLSICVD